MCGPSADAKKLNLQTAQFATDMIGQSKQVFGNDAQVFNQLSQAYGNIVANGVNQAGFNQTEMNAINSAIVSGNAQAFRNSLQRLSAAGGYGGGNEASASGYAASQAAEIGRQAAESEANQLTQAQIANYQTGRDNFFKAGEALSNAPNIFKNVPEFDKYALQGNQQAIESQQSIDAASNWWQKPVMGLVGAGLTAATGGLGSLASGSGFMSGFGKSLENSVGIKPPSSSNGIDMSGVSMGPTPVQSGLSS